MIAAAFALAAALTQAPPPHTAPPRAAAVVADIGPGTNPYHRYFRRPGWTQHPCTVIPGFSCHVPALPLTLGDDYAQNLTADQATWDNYQVGQLYWVPGTNLLLLTLRSWTVYDPAAGDGYGGPNAGHSTGTSSVIAQSCPDCYVLVIQDLPLIDGQAVRYVTEKLPWVDAVVSTNVTGDFLIGYYAFITGSLSTATKALADSGRLFFAASGNTAVSPVEPRAGVLTSQYNYPPWVVMVGGAEPFVPSADPSGPVPYLFCGAVDGLSGKPTEFVGPMVERMAAPASVDETLINSGTSFATPAVAARFAQLLALLRAELGDQRAPGALWIGAPRAHPSLADGRFTANEWRRVMANSSYYLRTQDYNISCPLFLAPAVVYVPLPASPTPWIEMGWGYVSTGAADFALDLLMQRASAVPKPSTAQFYMQQFMQLRARLFPESGTPLGLGGF